CALGTRCDGQRLADAGPTARELRECARPPVETVGEHPPRCAPMPRLLGGGRPRSPLYAPAPTPWDPQNTGLSCERRRPLAEALVSFNDAMDSSCDSVGINVPESLLLVKA